MQGYQVKLALKMLSSEKDNLEGAESVMELAGNSAPCVHGECGDTRPESEVASSFKERVRGNQGDPAAGVKGYAHPRTCNKRGRGWWRSEVGGTHMSDEVW